MDLYTTSQNRQAVITAFGPSLFTYILPRQERTKAQPVTPSFTQTQW